MSHIPTFKAPSLPTSPTTEPEAEDVTGERPRLSVGPDDSLEIANFTGEIAAPSSARDRLKFVQASASSSISLSDDALHAVARAMVSPDQAAAMVKANLYTTEVVEAANILSIPTVVWSTEMFPLLQPRTGAGALSIRAPKVTGITEGSAATAALELRFDNLSHLRSYLQQTVRETRRAGKIYDDSILARRISRPVIAHEARLAFDDGSESIEVVVVRDGLTRLVSSAAVRIGPKPTPDQIAEEMLTALLTPKNSSRAKDQTASQEYARGRDAYANDLRVRFARGMVGGKPSEDALRIGQTFTIPAQLYVGIEATTSNPLAPEQQFDDAIRAIVSSIHVEFQGWEEAASSAEVIDRAIQRVQHAGKISADVVDLASGVIDSRSMPTVFDEATPPTALWRAVYLVATVCDPDVFDALKRELRALLGMSRIENQSFVRYIAPVIDLPWRSVKRASLDQARSAWGNKGPIPVSMLNVKWTPQTTSDFTTLVEPALDGDRNARFTLQIAGGVALVADKVLTANSGSKIFERLVPFRSDVSDVIAGLGTSELGLWTLARAANSFDEKRVAANSLTKTQLQRGAGSDASILYRIPRISTDDPSKIKVDNVGTSELMTEWDVVWASNPSRAEEAEKAREDGQRAKQAASKGAQMPSPSDQAAQMRKNLLASVGQSIDSLKALIDLAAQNGSVGPALSTVEEWQDLNQLVQELNSLVFTNRPTSGSEA